MKAMRSSGMKIVLAAVLGLTGMLACVSVAEAQTSNIIQDNFTGTTAQLNWKSFNGACLTAGNNGTGTSGGYIPSCAANAYYTTSPQNDPTQKGLTSNADTVGNGALRLTDAHGNQNGAVIDQTPYPSNLGIQVTFTTYSYGGNSGGTAKDGADGIGFYLLGKSSTTAAGSNATSSQTDSSGNPLPNLGAFGGSLGYSCSNTNTPHNGMAGAYMGLGMDEFGNFLNNGDNTGTGDQATSVNGGNGAQYQPGRIGLRAYGNVNIAALQAANPHGTPTDTDVQNTCKNGGTYNWTDSSYTDAYTYQPGQALVSPSVSTSVTTQGTTTWTSAIDSTGKTRNLSHCGTSPTTAAIGPVVTTTGGQQNNGGTATAYSGTLYSVGTAVSGTPVTTTSQSSSTSATMTVYDSNNVAITCSGTTTGATITTTQTTTTYAFSTAGATNSSPAYTNASGFSGTGQMYGLVNGQYYPITFTSTAGSVTGSATLPDYAAIPNAFYNLPSSTPIANESAANRAAATPISYKLQITQSGLLSLWYSWNGGNYIPVLTGQSITTGNAPVPSSFLFGFGGSTGGSNNVHEITCFQVTPADVSSSSAGLNVQQAGQVKTGTQVYLASYHTNNWWGELTSQNLVVNGGIVSISTTVNWDASCVLTGGACTATNATSGAAQTAGQRVLLSWQDTATSGSGSNTGIALAWNTLTSTEQGWLNAGDSAGQNRLAYLTGDRSNEVPTTGAAGTQVFRDRNSVLGDIIDSSPTWVGPPSAPYPAVWKDKLYPTAVPAENATGSTTYPAFLTSNATRLNVVYDGANDGFLHGFEAGSYDASGNYVATSNDGKEVLAYMPQAVLQTIHNASNNALDFSSPSYGHNYFTDATPGTGDLFYNGTWHTWLVGGMGAGGNAIFALDITNPANFSNANAASTVIGEWSPSTLVCANSSTCGSSMGQSYGTPQIRRLHNGEWGIIFGNGLNSSSGHAGIFVMTFTTNGVLDKTYFLDTGIGSAGNPNGIAYVTPADLDGDHITDYVYAGDAYGNVWRFDLSSNLPANWAASTYGKGSPTPLFTTATTTTVTKTPASGSPPPPTVTIAPVALTAQATTPNGTTTTTSSGTTTTTVVTNQPITTAVTVVSVSPTAVGQPRVMVEFGTGAVVPQSITSSIAYAPGQQALYGVWDWYMGQAGTVNASFAGLVGSSSAPSSQITLSQLDQQSVTGTFSAAQSGIGQGARTLSNNLICFAGTTCATTSSNGTQTNTPGTVYGWYMNLPGYNGVSGVGGNNQVEQVIYSPIEIDGAFIVNTVVPANNSPLTCTAQTAQGWTMAVNPSSGSAFQNSFFSSSTGQFVTIGGSPVSGVALNATGSPSVVTANNNPYLVTQTVNGAGAVNQISPPGTLYTKRLTWLEIH